MIGGYGVPGTNDNGERICGLCASSGMIVTNTYVNHKDVNKYTLYRHREDWLDQSMIDLLL